MTGGHSFIFLCSNVLFSALGPIPSTLKLETITHSPLTSAVDSHGFSVLHHHICSLPGAAAYQNRELLNMLCRAGAAVEHKDKKGLTALDYALRKGAYVVVQELQKCMGLLPKSRVR